MKSFLFWVYGGVWWEEEVNSVVWIVWHKRSGSPFLCALLCYPFNSSVGSYDAFVLYLNAIQLYSNVVVNLSSIQQLSPRQNV